jgi:hypothetical protein
MRRLTFPVFASCLLFFVSCAAKVPPSGTTPGRPGTPIETALAYNASLADANQSITSDVISAQKAGLLDVTTTSNITSVEFTVADSDRQITSMLNAIATCQAAPHPAGAPACVGNASQLNTLIQRITANVETLTNSGEVGIKDSATQKSISKAATTIVQMAGLILDTLQTAKLIQ